MFISRMITNIKTASRRFPFYHAGFDENFPTEKRITFRAAWSVSLI
jgi:hypothetical protein